MESRTEGRSRAWRHLAGLGVGDRVPAECYVLDYSDGTRPRWTVVEVEEVGPAQRRLVVVDPDNGADDLFDDGVRAALTIITWPDKTMRSQPHQLGGSMGDRLCDMDQQGRHARGGES